MLDKYDVFDPMRGNTYFQLSVPIINRVLVI